MAAWIEPLALKTWMIQVFSGNPDIFGAVAIFFIAGMAGYFKMNALSMGLMLLIFVAMFSGYIGLNFLIVFALIGGLLAGYLVAKAFE